MPNKIDALYSEVSKSYEVGSIDDFKKYLADPKKRQLFFKEIIAPEYDVKSIDDFEEAYGFKKKSTESPGQGAQKDIFSVSGETAKAGPSEPSARKQYPNAKADIELGKRIQAEKEAIQSKPITQQQAEAFLPFQGKVAATSTVITPKKDETYFEKLGRTIAGGVTAEEAQAAISPIPQSKLEYNGEDVNSDMVNSALSSLYKLGAGLSRAPETIYGAAKAALPVDQRVAVMSALEPVMGSIKQGNVPAKELEKAAAEIDSKMQKVEGDVTDRFARGDYKNGFKLMGNHLAASVPQMAGVMLSGGGTAGMALLGISSASMRAKELEGQDISERQRYADAVAHGTAEVVFELFGAGSLARVAKEVIKREGADAGKKIVKDGMLDVVDNLTKKYPLLFGPAAEGLSEVATTIAQNAADKYSGIDPERDLLQGTADSYIIGSGMGFAAGSVIKTAQAILPQSMRDQVRKNQEDIQRAKDLSQDPNITSEKKNALEQLAAKKAEENMNLQRKSLEKLSFIPDETRDEYVALRTDMLDLESEIESEPDGLIREALESELETKKLQAKKIEQDAIQKRSTSKVPVQSEARSGEEVQKGQPQPEPQGVTEEGKVKEEVNQYLSDLQETKQSNPEQYWSVDSVTEEAAKEGTVITDEDGGVVVSKDGDIKGLFKKATSKAKGVAQKLLQKAVEAGGIKLDNFDNYLTPVYEKAGFRVVSRVPFNEEYAPEGWNKEKHGTPDVVAMVYDPQNKLDIQEQKFENYDDAMAYRDQLVEQAKAEYPMQTNFDEAVNKSAQSLNVVAPELKVIVGENIDDVQNQIVEAIAPIIGERQALQTAEEFATGTKGQTIFVDGKPFAVVFDKTTADSRTAGHEAWEVMLNDAFGNDQAKFKDFTVSIDSQLRAQGFEDIADALDAFASQRGYEAVKYSEYMAELGGMLVESGFGKGPLTAQQKTLLQKIGDIINKFAELFTGKKQFLDQATPEDILGFMVTISNKVAKGENVASFFRGKESTEKTSVKTRSQQAAIEILDGPKFDNKLKEDVAYYLNSLRDSEIPPNSSREQLMERFLNNVYEEVGYYLYSKPDARSAGLTWYIEDMVEFANKVKVVLPELSDENQYKLFLTVLAFTSSGTNPNQNLLYAYNLWNNSNDPKNFEFSKNWAEKKLSFIDKKGKPVASGVIVKETAKEYTVELVDSLGRPVVDSKGNKKQEKVSKASMKPGYPKPTGYTNRGEIIVGQLEKLEKLYADLGSIDAVVKWLETPHPIAELRKYNESVPDVNGKGPGKTNKEYDPKKNAEGERNGAFIFGEKIGSFYQNMIGIGETITMDLWWSRTWNRYMGTMINTVSGKKEIQEVPRSDRERNIMREAVKMVAKDLNLQVSELQAAIWYFEQELWTKSGNESPSYSYVTAIDDLTKKLKVDEETRTKLRAAEADLTEAEKRRQNAAERAAAVVASKGGKLPEIKVTAKSQKAFEESIQKEEDSVKLKYSNSGKLLAPNGKPSNLPEYLARYTRTNVFKSWFGDWENDPKNSSKVVDENGEPALVYHGSPFGGITRFDRRESAKATSGLKEFGTYFTTNRNVAEVYASEGKISQEKINEINQQINKLEQARDNTRNSSEYYNLEKEIEALKKNKSPKVYAAFLNLRSIKDFDAESKSFPEAWRNLKVDAGYKTATDRDAMDFLKEGKFGVEKVDGVKASNIIDLATGTPKREAVDFVGDVYLVFDDINDAIRVVEPQTVTTRSQKNVPAVVDEVLTDDGKGNYLFVHYSDDTRDVIKPMSGSKRNFTSREEVSAISSVGGLAMYYTKAGQKENGVGDVPHTVLVPKDKVYFYGTTDRGKVSHDPEGFEAEARRRFQEYKNRGNEKNPTVYAFDSNNSAAWVTKVAGENGYDMVVTNWGGPKGYRAQTTKTLKAEDEYTGFKKPEPVVFEVGDEIFVSGSYANVTSVNGSLVRYEGTNQYGNPTSGVFDTNRNSNVVMIEKAKPSVTTRSQKVEVKTIPGYDRMMNEVSGIMDKTMNRGGSYNQASANAINYIQKSAAYERADDIQREQIIRDFKKLRGEKMKNAPSVAKIMGQIKDVKEVTVKESTALKDQIKLEAKAAKDSAAFVKQLRMDISNQLKSMVGRGVLSARQATAIISRYDKMNILNPVMRDRFIDYMSRVFQSAEYMDKIKESSKLRASIKKNMKSAANQAEIAKIAKDFADIDPSRVESIDDYINNATQMLNAVARKTGDPLMRSLVNAADMASYIETEIEAQREQIKNELLDKYKDLVDAGVLSSDMTINEIKKVIAAIEQNDNEAVAKEEKAKEAIKEMMAEVSPLILQTVKTGEDPFTGEPISLTQDEKKSLIALTKIDTDSLSLSEALQVLEYANNFIANGITSGVDGMVSLYQGNLNAGELVDDGIKSIPLSKYLSKAVGKVWGEGFATLPMLNKLLWGNTRRAIMVSDKAGINGISNGKAKALKMVDTAVKQYVKQFSKVKDFLASENVVERGVFAFMSRNVIGDEFQVQDEFNRRKSLIEETIQALSDVNNSTDAEIKKGEVIQKVYDKVLKDAKNIDDVKKNVSKVNQDAVNWWINKWSENFDRLDEVSRNVYNTLLSRDINYTPDRFQMKEAPTATEEDFDSGFFGNFEYVDTSKSGSLRQNNRIKTLPKDSNGVRKRIVNLDFDVNNVNALTSAMVDVETASSVMQLKGFATSKNFSKLFSNKEDKNLYKKRLVKYVNRVKGGSYVDQNELAKVNRFINTVASFGVAKALFSVSQPFKQFIPPMLNTLSQTGRFDIGELFNGGMQFIDRSGYPIANRGVASQGELKSINRQLVEADKNVGVQLLDFFANISNKALELTLKNPDVYAARASWISFYIKDLQRQGQKISNIDWNTHEINKKAADYAQAMVDSQQNISDTDMQGEIFASKQPATVFLRRALLPLMTFTLNQKTRVWSDIRTLSNNVSSNQDKIEAAKSLSGALVELVAFQGVSLAFKELYNVIAASIMGEDEDEEEKKIRKMRQSQSTAQAFMKDFFLPPIPGMDIVASKGINYLLDETGLSDELPGKWFDIQDEEQKYRLYDKMNQGYLNMLGTQGIAAEKALELVDYYDAAIDGEFTKEYNGNKVKKALMEEDLDLARLNAILMTGYYGGLLPSDMANIVNIMNKKIQKRAEQVEGD